MSSLRGLGRVPSPDRPAENKVFTNREHPIKVFKETIKTLKPDDPKILVFHGIGGQGKSALCDEFKNRMTPKNKRVDKDLSNAIFGHIDLRNGESQRAWEALLRLRFSFAENSSIPFHTFDIAFATFWEKQFQGSSPIDFSNRLFSRNEDILTDIGAGGAEAASSLLEGFPIIGALLVKSGRWAFKKIKPLVIKKIKKDLNRLTMPDGEIIPGHKIQELLPYFLITDIKAYNQEKPEKKIVFLLDEYESVWKERPTNPQLRDNPIDIAFQELVIYGNGILFVFFSREKLNWEARNPEWKNYFEGAQHPLGGLTTQDADSYLSQIPVTDPDLRKAMIVGAKFQENLKATFYVHPFLLDQQVEHYMRMKYDLAQQPKPENFLLKGEGIDQRVTESNKRFFRDYNIELEWLLKRLSLTRWFDRDFVKTLIARFGIAFPMDEFEGVLKISIVSRIDGSDSDYALHRLFGDLVKKELTSEMREETRDFYIDYYLEHSKFDQPKDATNKNLSALSEYIFHVIEGGDPKTLNMAVEEMDKHLETSYVSSLLPTINYFYDKVLETEENKDNPTSGLVFRALSIKANILYLTGKNIEAKPIFQKVLEFSEQNNSFDLRQTFHLMNNFGNNYMHAMQYEEAESLYRRALKIAKEELKSDSHLLSISFNNLGNILSHQGKYEDSESMFRKAIEICEKGPENKEHDIISALSSFGVTLDDQGKYEEAELIHRRALKISKDKLGEDHPKYSIALNNLGTNLFFQKKYKESELCLLQAIKVHEKCFGETNQDYALFAHNIAENYYQQRKYNDAESFYRQAVKIGEIIFGFGDKATLLWSYNLMLNLLKQGKNKESEFLQHRLMKHFEETNGANPSQSIGLFQFLAKKLESKNGYIEAESLLRKALEITAKEPELSQPEKTSILNNLAINLDSQHRHKESEQFYRQAIKCQETQLGQDHLDTAFLLGNLAYNLCHQSLFNEAETLYRKTLKIYEEKLGPDNIQTIMSIRELALFLDRQKGYEEAESLHRKGLKICEAKLGVSHKDTRIFINNLGCNLSHQNKYKEAELLLYREIKICIEKLGFDHTDTIESVKVYTQFLEKQKRYEDAEIWHRRVLEIYVNKFKSDNENIRFYLTNLAENLLSQNKFCEAEKLYRRNLKTIEEKLDSNHPAKGKALMILANTIANQSRYSEAEPYFCLALEFVEEKFGSNHSNTKFVMSSFANNLDRLGQFDQATDFHQRACTEIDTNNEINSKVQKVLKTRNIINLVLKGDLKSIDKIDQILMENKEIFEPTERMWSKIRSDLGVAYFLLGKTDRSIEIFREVKLDLESINLSKQPIYTSVLFNLGAALTQNGQTSESQIILDKASKLDAKSQGPGSAWRIKDLPPPKKKIE